MIKNANEEISAKTSADVTVTFTQDDAKRVVGKINDLAKKTVEKGCMDIGDLVLNEVFQGNLSEACSKDPFKSNSLAMVCKDPDLVVNRRRLGEWVKAAALRKELIANKVDCFWLSYSHFVALLLLNDETKRLEVGKKANSDQWPVRKLSEEIRKEKAAKTKGGKAENHAQLTRAEEVMKAAGDFLDLMQDEETQRLLDDPQVIKDRLAYDIRIHFAHSVNDLVKRMSDAVNLLKRAKRNITQIEVEALQASDDDAIDVEATVV